MILIISLIQQNPKEILRSGVLPKVMSELSSTSLATKIERSENKLTEALTRCNISLPGQSWIDFAFDIFKDNKGRTPCVGQPDRSARNIYVSTYTSQMTISRPASVPAGSTWDCHIMNLQQNNLTRLYQQTPVNNNTFALAVAPAFVDYGGVQVLAGASGSALGFANSVGNLFLPDSYFRGQLNAKVIGKGHEILNTTAPLYVQGDLLYYQKTLPDPELTKTTINWISLSATNNLYTGALDYYNNVSALNTPAELIVLPKARKLLAKQGVYQTCTLCSNDNVAKCDMPIGQLVTGISPSRWLTNPGWTNSAATTVPPINIVSPEISSLQSPFVSPFNLSGTYLTGLSSDTTFNITAKWMVEVSPPVSDTKMMSLSHMSPPDDECAMEVYHKIAYALDAGTPVANNADGDWIATVADLAVEFGVPGAGIIRKGVQLAKNFYNGGGIADMVNPSSNQGNKSGNMKLKSFRGTPTQDQWERASNYNIGGDPPNKGNKKKKKKKTGNQKQTKNTNVTNNRGGKKK